MGKGATQISEHSRGCKGRKAPLAYTYSGETNDFRQKAKTTPSFAPTSVLHNGLRAFNKLAFIYFPPVEADSSLVVLDFFLAHRAVPYVLCTSRHGLFAPRDSARSAAPLVGKA